MRELALAYEQVPALESFRPWIDSLRRRADRILDPEAERVLGLAGDNLWAAIDLNELPSPLETAFGSLVAEMPFPPSPTLTSRSFNSTFPTTVGCAPPMTAGYAETPWPGCSHR